MPIKNLVNNSISSLNLLTILLFNNVLGKYFRKIQLESNFCFVSKTFPVDKNFVIQRHYVHCTIYQYYKQIESYLHLEFFHWGGGSNTLPTLKNPNEQIMIKLKPHFFRGCKKRGNNLTWFKTGCLFCFAFEGKKNLTNVISVHIDVIFSNLSLKIEIFWSFTVNSKFYYASESRRSFFVSNSHKSRSKTSQFKTFLLGMKLKMIQQID